MKFEEPGHKLLRSSVVDILDKQKIDPNNFMDIGCGAGSPSKFLIQRGLLGTGVEISAQALGECQELLADEIDKGTFTLTSGLDDCSEKFELVICIRTHSR